MPCGYDHSKIKACKSPWMALDWFNENHTKANISNFQSIASKTRSVIAHVTLSVYRPTVKSLACVNLLWLKLADAFIFTTVMQSCFSTNHSVTSCQLGPYIMRFPLISFIAIYSCTFASYSFMNLECLQIRPSVCFKWLLDRKNFWKIWLYSDPR